MSSWYLIHTKHAGEALAESHLERQCFSVYLPRVAQAVRKRGRWKTIVVPLFPRYLFVGLDRSQSLAPIRSTIGVSSVVRFGRNYAAVPDRIVRELKSKEDPLSGLHRLNACSLLSPGTAVRITAGPLGGLEGIFQQQVGAERVVVLLDLLGQAARVRVPVDFVRPSCAA